MKSQYSSSLTQRQKRVIHSIPDGVLISERRTAEKNLEHEPTREGIRRINDTKDLCLGLSLFEGVTRVVARSNKVFAGSGHIHPWKKAERAFEKNKANQSWGVLVQFTTRRLGCGIRFVLRGTCTRKQEHAPKKRTRVLRKTAGPRQQTKITGQHLFSI